MFRSFIFMNVFNLMCVSIVNFIWNIFQCTLHTLVPHFLTKPYTVSPAYEHFGIFNFKMIYDKDEYCALGAFCSSHVCVQCDVLGMCVKFHFIIIIILHSYFSCWTLNIRGDPSFHLILIFWGVHSVQYSMLNNNKNSILTCSLFALPVRIKHHVFAFDAHSAVC